MFKPFSLKALAQPLSGQLIGAEVFFDSVSTDSRAIQAGQLFVALMGERFDGHQYLTEVATRGAVGAVVQHAVSGVALPQLVVADTRLALGQLGALNRGDFTGLMAAVTGSSGKTTVKEMIASILRAAHGSEAVLATRGNLNNELGVPLTLLDLNAAHKSAILELGASHPGEIAYTVSLVQPQVAVITNAGLAHVGEFGGPEHIVAAKGEILEGLPPQGIAVLNRDDPAFDVWRRRATPRTVLSFGLHPQAEVRATQITQDALGHPSFHLEGPWGTWAIRLEVLGQHNVLNACAAAAVTYALGIMPEYIQTGLAAVLPVKGRAVSSIGLNGVRLIDDSYNANPASIQAATDLLQQCKGQRVLVLGDMGELGGWSEAGHRHVGEYAQGKVEALYVVGPQMAHAAAAFGPNAHHFSDQTQLIAALRPLCHPHTTLLIKGSRSAAMERIVAALSSSTMETL